MARKRGRGRGEVRDAAKPFYLQIREQLLADYEGKAGERLPSEKELCERYGVSRPTVRKALESLVEQGLVVRKPGKGSFVQKRPKSKVKAQEGVVVFVPGHWKIEEHNHFYLTQILAGILPVSHERKVDLNIVNFVAAECRAKLDRFHTHTAIWLSPYHGEYELMDELVGEGYCCAVINRRIPDARISYVMTSNTPASAELTGLLLDAGHRRVALAGMVRNTDFFMERRRGFLKAHRARGVVHDPALVVGKSFSTPACRKEFEALLRGKDRPTAVFCTSGFYYEPVLQAIERAGLKMPDDVSMTGFDEMPGISVERGLTVASQPLVELGRMCVEQVLAYRKSGKPFRTVLEPDLMKRTSVRAIG